VCATSLDAAATQTTATTATTTANNTRNNSQNNEKKRTQRDGGPVPARGLAATRALTSIVVCRRTQRRQGPGARDGDGASSDGDGASSALAPWSGVARARGSSR
jgi:hypothetical protein